MDHTDFKLVDNKKEGTLERKPVKVLPSSLRWWLAEEDTLPAAVMSHVAQIIKTDKGRIDSYNTYAKLYGTYTPTFFNGYQLSSSGKSVSPVRDRLTYNIIQSCIDTWSSMLVENKPKPMFLTQAGDSKVQQRAKKLDAYCYGVFYANNTYRTAPKTGRDAAVFGDGYTHVFVQDGQVKFERVLPYELLDDYLEGHYGPESVKSKHRIKNIDRTELAEMFPDKSEEISRISSTSSFLSSSNMSVGDTVTVIESWRLKTGSSVGRHCIVVDGCVLFDEEYQLEFFPFAKMPFNPRLYGPYSQGMAEQLVPTQLEINRTLISIQRSLYLGGTHKIFVKNGSKVIKSHFDNLIGTILEWAGDTPPQYVVPQLVQPEIYQHLNDMIARGYQLPGISQMQATSLKSPGVNSGRAMRTEQNIHSQRQESSVQMYEDYFMQLAKITVAVSRKAFENADNITVKVPGKRFIQSISWKDVSLEDDEFVLQIYPVSKLPQDPEGRLQTIQEMMQANLIDPQTGRRLLDYPDLDSEENLANATRDYLHKILDGIVDSGKYVAPEADDNLVLGKQLVLEYIAQGKLNNLSSLKMEMLRDFNKQIDMYVDQAKAAAQAEAQAAAAPPVGPAGPVGPAPANPEPTPTSDMLPNVNGAA